MNAKLVKESLSDNLQNKDTDILKIQSFVKENGFDFGFTKKDENPYIKIPVDYDVKQNYDTETWPAIATYIKYVFSYTEQEKPISLRKIWYGHEGVKPFGDNWRKPQEGNLRDRPIHNLKQNLIGRYSTIEEALDRVNLNIKKELSK